MMQNRTDLALEQAAALSQESGIRMEQRGKAFRITEICIERDEDGKTIGRGKGRYVTLECEQLSHFSDSYRLQVEELAEELRRFLPEGNVLVAGLGNQEITPDALGPLVAGRIFATRHLRHELQVEDPELAFLHQLRPVSVLANGVLGQTGIETAELIAALKEAVSPRAVIAVDALACSDLKRLGTTIQIADAGISPGSGVQNKRKELSCKTLGVPVIAVGVPTVVDMHTIVRSYASDPGVHIGTFPNMMVTPRDIDKLIRNAAKLIADSLNLALHPQMTFEDVESLG